MRVAAGVAVGQRREQQGARMGRHVQAVRDERLAAEDDADGHLRDGQDYVDSDSRPSDTPRRHVTPAFAEPAAGSAFVPGPGARAGP